MGLIESLNLAPVAAAPSGVAATLGLDIVSQMAAVAAKQPAPPTFTPEFAAAVDAIQAKGYGFPALGAEAAKAYAGLMISRGGTGYNPDAQGFAGGGDLGQVMAMDMARVIGIAAELAPLPAKNVPAPVAPPVVAPAPIVPMTTMGLLPPDAAVSKPELAAVPVEGFTMPGLPITTATVTPGVLVPGLIASVPAAVAAPIMAAAAPIAVAPTTTIAPAGDAPKKRGRKPGSKNTPKEEPDTDRWLFVDCMPSCTFENLQPWVDNITVGMAKHFKIDPEDLRMAPKDSTLSFGGWQGAVTAVVRKAAESLAPGVYYLDTRSSGFNEHAIEGLRTARVKNTDGTDGDSVFDMITRNNR